MGWSLAMSIRIAKILWVRSEEMLVKIAMTKITKKTFRIGYNISRRPCDRLPGIHVFFLKFYRDNPFASLTILLTSGTLLRVSYLSRLLPIKERS